MTQTYSSNQTSSQTSSQTAASYPDLKTSGSTILTTLFSLLAAISIALVDAPDAQAQDPNFNRFAASAQKLSSSNQSDYYFWDSLPAAWLKSDSTAPNMILREYHSEVRRILSQVDVRFLIARQREVYRKHAGSLGQRAMIMFDLVLNETVGNIQNVSTLDALLLRYHLETNRTHWVRTEFFAAILEKKGVLRAYAGFGKHYDGAAPSLDPVRQRIQGDLKSGWRLISHVHNHPFSSPDQLDWGGAIVASPSDIYAYSVWAKELGLIEGRVTNGFETFSLPITDLRKYPESLFRWPPKL